MIHTPLLRQATAFSLLFLLFSGNLCLSCKPVGKNANGQNNGEVKPIDSTTVTRWDVIPKGDMSHAYRVYKDSGLYWKVMLENKVSVDADLKVVNRSLRHFSDFKKMKPASLDKAKWAVEQIDDKGNRIVVYTNNQKADSFIISRLEFTADNKSSYYIRKAGTDSVYQLSPDYLEGSMLAPDQSFRKKEMAPVNPDFYKTLKIVLPGTNEYYLIEKLGSKWSMNGRDADQQKVNGYAKILSRIQIPAFAPPPPTWRPDAYITIETSYGPIKLTANREGQTDRWILGSSVNIGNYLYMNTQQINAIFLPANFFMPPEK